MNKSIACTAIALIILACTSVSVCYSEPPDKGSNVTVCTLTLNGKGLPGVRINMTTGREKMTDEKGCATFLNLAPASYTIAVPKVANGYSFRYWNDTKSPENTRTISIPAKGPLEAMYGPTAEEVTITIKVKGLSDDAIGPIIKVNQIEKHFKDFRECDDMICYSVEGYPGNDTGLSDPAQRIESSKSGIYYMLKTPPSEIPSRFLSNQTIVILYQLVTSDRLVIMLQSTDGKPLGNSGMPGTIVVVNNTQFKSLSDFPDGSITLPLGKHTMSPRSIENATTRYQCSKMHEFYSAGEAPPRACGDIQTNTTLLKIIVEYEVQYKIRLLDDPSLLFKPSVRIEPPFDWFDNGTTVTLFADPMIFYDFVGWIVNGTSNPTMTFLGNPLHFTVEGPRGVTPQFKPQVFQILALTAFAVGACSLTVGFLLGRGRKGDRQEYPLSPPYPPASLGFSTVRGRRETDEDSILVTELRSGSYLGRRTRMLLVVADGVGGRKAGEMASSKSCMIIAQELSAELADTSKSMDPGALMARAVGTANKEVFLLAGSQANLRGMATALTTALIDEDRLYIAHAGNCRAYLVRSGTITQLTRDHTYVQELIERGEISPDQARFHPKRNAITRAVGNKEHLVVDTYTYPLAVGDQLLLCTDGLTEHVSNEEIMQVIQQARGDTQGACDALVNYALLKGSTDNISVILTTVIRSSPHMPYA